ncbi:BREX-1 system adenine-specific DNA-methyltransferase PglX [Clostridiaceae bacterium]|nr:BREX-1 system adenine-specific DNA-methyltransferase PglX [Clostridiaceae bacterium]RKI11670.1 BREX-1 system adenine-specific DNA-methyltransferase PglX [bacterium 1XD21-70]
MNKIAIKNFSVWARNKLIDDIRYRAGLLGITENGVQPPLPQSAKDTEFYDIGTGSPYSISGEAVSQRRKLVEAIREKERKSDYPTAYKYIVEEVAYTWFNRLIAIRFMEVNDYLPSHIRVLSSDSGKLEPDLVTTPFGAELSFSADEEQMVMGFKRDNQIDELFRLLFIKQCNTLNEILPGLFEKTNDYTELLLSVSVIDQDGVVYRLTHDIDEDDFNIEKGGQVEIIGWLYQYWNTEPKDAVFGRPSGQKIKKEEIPAATQLFTPDWIVRYMVENSLGRLWVEGHPNEELKTNWNYYLDEAEQEPTVQTQLAEIRKEYAVLNPEDIKCIDPCMGSGHILCYLFDVLMQIYESQGYSQRDAAQSIVQHNLYGLDIDRRATQLAYFSVMMKARQYDRRFLSRNLQPMVYSTTGDEEGENFGSLVMVDDPGEMPEDPQTVFEFADYEQRLDAWNYRCLLTQKYHVVVTNPPYMAVSNGNGPLQDYVKKNFPDSKADLFAVFIERCGQLAGKNGYQAMITQHAWMFLSSFEKLRAKLQTVDTVNMAHLGPRAFEEIGGEVVQTTSFVIRKSHVKGYKGIYCRLIELTTQQGKEEMFLSGEKRYTAQQDNFLKIPGAPVAYWVSENIFLAFLCESLFRKAKFAQGLITGDVNRFTRLWYEVSWSVVCVNAQSIEQAKVSPYKWFPYNKGGDYRKWYGNNDYLVNWKDDGYEIRHFADANGKLRSRPQGSDYYFCDVITWTKISSAQTAFRHKPAGHISSEAGMTISIDEHQKKYVLGYCNSVVANYILKILSPTLNYELGDVAKLPVLYIASYHDKINRVVENSEATSRQDWDSFETSWDFIQHPLVRGVSTVAEAFGLWEAECEGRFQQLKANEEELNRIFIDIYGLQDELMPEVEDKDVTVRRADLGRDVRSLLSYAVGCMFGRYSLDVDGLAYAGGEWDAAKYSKFLPDADGILPITDEEYLEDDIVTLLCVWLKKVYGADTLEENLDFIAKALGNKGATSREVIRNYFLKDFFADHCKIYQKRPIYWLFDSGKQNGFKALIYLHRYTPDTIGNVRIDYLHRMQRVYENEIDRMQDMIEHSKNPREVAASAKRREKLQKQLKECREYDEKISHLALSRIELDLDDGVKVNYRKMQTASDSKFYEVLADSKNIMGKK